MGGLAEVVLDYSSKVLSKVLVFELLGLSTQRAIQCNHGWRVSHKEEEKRGVRFDC